MPEGQDPTPPVEPEVPMVSMTREDFEKIGESFGQYKTIEQKFYQRMRFDRLLNRVMVALILADIFMVVGLWLLTDDVRQAGGYGLVGFAAAEATIASVLLVTGAIRNAGQ